MFKINVLILAATVVCVSSRYLKREDFNTPYLFIEDGRNIRVYDLEDALSETKDYEQNNLSRVRRQLHGSITSNSDGSLNSVARLPIVGSNRNMLSALGSVSGASGNGGFRAAGGGLAWDNVNGHGASLTGQHIPGFGNQLNAAGKLNLLNTNRHDITANAFATRNFPNNPNIPNFNTYGGNLGYMFDKKIGASVGMAHTDLFKKTDYSAMGNLNLFRGRNSALDFNAGMTKSVSPFLPRTGWQPSAGLSFTRWF